MRRLRLLCARLLRKGSDAMDYIWSPWRYQYMAQCWLESSLNVFFRLRWGKDDAETLVVHRGEKACHPESLPLHLPGT